MKKYTNWYILRREPYYHKIQYSKSPKFDPAAAVFGVVVGAFVVYMTLSTVGSGGADLTDLTCCIWYTFLILSISKLWLTIQKSNSAKWVPGFTIWNQLFIECTVNVFSLFNLKKKKCNNMFMPRVSTLTTPQKNRHNRIKQLSVKVHLKGWTKLLSLGQGFVNYSFIERAYVYCKKMSSCESGHSSIWFNVSSNVWIRKKAAQTRMGKGCGTKSTCGSGTRSGITLLAISSVRPGLMKNFKRHIQVRCSFKVGIEYSQKQLNNNIPQNSWLFFKKTQQRYLMKKRYEITNLLSRTNNGQTLALYRDIFKWFRKKPWFGNSSSYSLYKSPEVYWSFDLAFPFTPTQSVRMIWGWFEDYDDIDIIYDSDIFLDNLEWIEVLMPSKKWDWIDYDQMFLITTFMFAAKENFLEPSLRSEIFELSTKSQQWVFDIQIISLVWYILIFYSNNKFNYIKLEENIYKKYLLK